MAIKVDAGRRCADLLAALARTANVRLALQETGISAGWAYGRRKADPDFKGRWDRAIDAGQRAIAEAAAARARDAGAERPGGSPALAVAGSLGKGTLRLERVKPTRFTDERRAAFLDALRATCNVKAAAGATGVSPHAAYNAYHADAAFRDGWAAALAEGRVHLEMALMGAARALFEWPDERARPVRVEAPVEQVHPVVAAGDVTGMDARLALQLLRLHRPPDDPRGGGARRGWLKPAGPEETRAAILAKVAAVRAAGAERG